MQNSSRIITNPGLDVLEVEWTFNVDTSPIYAIIRVLDASNYIRIGLNNGNLIVVRIVNNAQTVIRTITGIGVGPKKLTARIDGVTTYLLIDGVPLTAFGISSALGTGVGIQGNIASTSTATSMLVTRL